MNFLSSFLDLYSKEEVRLIMKLSRRKRYRVLVETPIIIMEGYVNSQIPDGSVYVLLS